MMDWKLKPEGFVLEGIPGFVVLTTGRDGGMPAGRFQVEDLRRVVERAGLRPKAVIGMGQVHGAVVRRVEGGSNEVVAGCDGLVTGRPEVALVARSADCLPIVVWDPVRRVIGVAHAGWRGIRAWVARGLVEELGSGELQAAIGPGIGPCCYEVGPEFEEWFPQQVVRRQGKRFLDLRGAACSQLMRAGVAEGNIQVAGWCTACTPEHCHSYRRDGAAAGRMATVAMMLHLETSAGRC